MYLIICPIFREILDALEELVPLAHLEILDQR